MQKFLLPILLLTSLFAREYIAIIDFEGINVSEADAKALTQRLTSEMIILEVYQVLERSEMKRLLEEQKFQYSGCVDLKCAVELGKMLGAKYMVVGSISKVGSTYSIDSRLIDVKTSESYVSAKYDYTGKFDMLMKKGMVEIAHQLSEIVIDKQSKLKEISSLSKDIQINTKSEIPNALDTMNQSNLISTIDTSLVSDKMGLIELNSKLDELDAQLAESERVEELENKEVKKVSWLAISKRDKIAIILFSLFIVFSFSIPVV